MDGPRIWGAQRISDVARPPRIPSLFNPVIAIGRHIDQRKANQSDRIFDDQIKEKDLPDNGPGQYAAKGKEGENSVVDGNADRVAHQDAQPLIAPGHRVTNQW